MIGAGVAMLSQARLGLSPYDVLVSGLQPRLGLSFGQTVWAVSGLFFLIAILLGQRPSRWGIAYVLATGVANDAVAGLIGRPEALIARVGFWLTVLIMTLTVSRYLTFDRDRKPLLVGLGTIAVVILGMQYVMWNVFYVPVPKSFFLR